MWRRYEYNGIIMTRRAEALRRNDAPYISPPSERAPRNWREDMAQEPSSAEDGALSLRQRLSRDTQILHNRLAEVQRRVERGSYPPGTTPQDFETLRAKDKALISHLAQQLNVHATSDEVLRAAQSGEATSLEPHQLHGVKFLLDTYESSVRNEQRGREKELDVLAQDSIDTSHFVREYKRTRNEVAGLTALKETWQPLARNIDALKPLLRPGEAFRLQDPKGDVYGCVIENVDIMPVGVPTAGDLVVKGMDPEHNTPIYFVISSPPNAGVTVSKKGTLPITFEAQWFDVG